MIEMAHTSHGPAQRGAVEQVAFLDLNGQARQRSPIAATASEGAHGHPRPEQLAHEIGAHEAGGTGDKRVHITLTS